MKQKAKIILEVALVLFFLSVCYTCTHQEEEIHLETKEEEKEEEIVEVETYSVDMKGAVLHPGVYQVPKDSRVIDVIEKAGGLSKDANTDFLNLSKKVEDGEMLWVYTNQEIASLTENKTIVEYVQEACHCPDVKNAACLEEGEVSSKVNINTASKEELMRLSGIGEAKADAIITYRKKTKFQKIEDIKNVSGIGDSVYEKIKDDITV